MKDFRNYTGQQIENAPTGAATLAKSFLANVFSYMSGALAITGVIAYAFGNNLELLSYLRNVETNSMTMLGYAVMFAPLIMVLMMSFTFNKLSSFALLALFIAFSILMGMSLSFVFLFYTGASITSTFGITARNFWSNGSLGIYD